MAEAAAEISVPGKLILMGEHAAVYGRPAVVAALGLRTTARVRAGDAEELELDLPDLDYRERCSWNDIAEFGRRRRARWERYRSEPTPENFAALRSRDAAAVVKIALAEALSDLGSRRQGERSGNRWPSVRLTVRSELPLGSGFGSSASVAVAVAAAMFAACGEPRDRERIAGVALEVERRQHGQPSGIDHATVLRGGFLFLEPSGDRLRVTELDRSAWFRSGVRVFDSGAPAETTGEVVALVRGLRDRRPERFGRILDAMEQQTRAFARAMTGGRTAWPEVLAAVRGFERSLEEIGVVPEPVRRAVRRVEAVGAAAKVSGAGALAGPGAGSLVVFWPPEAGPDPGALLPDYRSLDAPLGVAGLEWGNHVDAG